MSNTKPSSFLSIDEKSTKKAESTGPVTNVVEIREIINLEHTRRNLVRGGKDINEKDDWFRLRQKRLEAYWSKYKDWVKVIIKRECADCYFGLTDPQLDDMYNDFYKYSLDVDKNGVIRIEDALNKKNARGLWLRSFFQDWVRNACRTPKNNYFKEAVYKATRTKLRKIKKDYETAKRSNNLNEDAKKKYELTIYKLERKMEKCAPKNFWQSRDNKGTDQDGKETSYFDAHELESITFLEATEFSMDSSSIAKSGSESELNDLSYKILLEATALPEESAKCSTDKKKYRILKELIESRDLTQKEIASRCRTTQPNVSHHLEELARKAKKILMQYSPGKAKADEIGNTVEDYLKLAGRVNDLLKGKLSCKIEDQIKQLLGHRYTTIR